MRFFEYKDMKKNDILESCKKKNTKRPTYIPKKKCRDDGSEWDSTGTQGENT
jgi:hypothetical protein